MFPALRERLSSSRKARFDFPSCSPSSAVLLQLSLLHLSLACVVLTFQPYLQHTQQHPHLFPAGPPSPSSAPPSSPKPFPRHVAQPQARRNLLEGADSRGTYRPTLSVFYYAHLQLIEPFGTRQDLFRQAFGLPEEEEPMGEVHAVLTMSGMEREEAYVRSFPHSLPRACFSSDAPLPAVFLLRSLASSTSPLPSSPSLPSTDGHADSRCRLRPSGGWRNWRRDKRERRWGRLRSP